MRNSFQAVWGTSQYKSYRKHSNW